MESTTEINSLNEKIAKGYDSFYIDHLGTRTCAKSNKKIDLELIREYYIQIKNKSTCDNVSDNI